MTRGLGLGFSKAVSTTTHEDVIKQQEDDDRLVAAGVKWFGHVLNHFEAPTLPDGTCDARIFTDPDLVLRAVPVEEVGAAAVRALTNPDSNAGRVVRGKPSDRPVAPRKTAVVVE